MRLIFVLLVLLFTKQCVVGTFHASRWKPTDIIPSRMAGTHLDEEIHIAKIRVGTPSKELVVALNFSGNGMVISSVGNTGSTAGDIPGSDPSDWSSTYSSIGGGTDFVKISSRQYRVPISYDSRAAALAGCPTCSGVLGVGPGSPIWLVWSGATFGAGAVSLGERMPQVAGASAPRISCKALESDLCVSEAAVFGARYDVIFRFSSVYTTLPAKVYDTYVGTRSVSNTMLQDWPKLVLRFSSADAPIDPRHPTLEISPQSFIGNSRAGGAQTLLLKRSSDPNSKEIILGRTIWRSLLMYREWVTGTAVIVTYDSTKRFPTWTLFVFAAIAFLFQRWWTTRDALYYEAVNGKNSATTVRPIERRATSAVYKFALALVPWLSYANNERYRRRIYVVSDNKQAEKLKRAQEKVWDGETSAPWSAFVNQHQFFPGEWGVYPDRLFIEIVAIGGAVATLYIPRLREAASAKLEFWVYLQIIVYLMVTWSILEWVVRLFGQADAFGVLHYTTNRYAKPTTFVVFRVALIRQAAVDILLGSAFVMVCTTTRTTSLGTTVMTLGTSIFSGTVLYHFLAAVVHLFRFKYRYPVGERGEGVWMMWIIFMALISIGTAAFNSAFVFIPFMQIHVTSANAADYVLAIFTMYGLGLMLAFILVSYEADRMADWLMKQRDHNPAIIVSTEQQQQQQRTR